jgi:hypothetical protein
VFRPCKALPSPGFVFWKSLGAEWLPQCWESLEDGRIIEVMVDMGGFLLGIRWEAVAEFASKDARYLH